MKKTPYASSVVLRGMVIAASLGAPVALAVDLSDKPLAVQNRVAPNVMFSLDNSSSMQWSYSSNSVFYTSRNGRNGYNGDAACAKNSSANRMYYNPDIIYEPGMRSNGQRYPNADFTRAYVDGYNENFLYGISGADPHFFPDGQSIYYARVVRNQRDPINLASEFRAYFDSEGQTYFSGHPTNEEYHFADPQHAFYYEYIGTSPAEPVPGECYPDSSYRKVIVSNAPTSRGVRGHTNFANWFSYHRTRMLVMKTAVSIAFGTLGSNYRVGFSTINDARFRSNNTGYKFMPVKEFESCSGGTLCHKDNWYATLFSIFPVGGTPLVDALMRVGDYYANGTMRGVSTTHPDPITHSCQQNYLVMSSDGAWTGIPEFEVGNRDRIVPALPEAMGIDPVAGVKLVPGTPFPRPFYEGDTASSNTLADAAMKYWISDLRPGMQNDVSPNDKDKATWQHMTTFAIGLGISGSLPHPSSYQDLMSGAKNWPVPTPNSGAAVDDMWHAAVNGHGAYFSARDAESLQRDLAASLTEIIGRSASAAGVAISNPDVTASENSAFFSSYHSGHWTGDLQAYKFDLATGTVDITNRSWPSSAQAQLDAKPLNLRFIGTYSGSTGVAFSTGIGGMSLAQLSRLNSSTTPPGRSDHASVISFLRGDRSNEGTLYRSREHILGDIINAAPVFVGKPTVNYGDAGFSAYVDTVKNRKKMVYQAANDGMLHAFDAATGSEQWAYVPNRAIQEHHLAGTTVLTGTSALVNLTEKTGFSHRYHVDGTPVQADVDLSNTSPKKTGTNWATLLVGGLNKGGRGYYALDVTSPLATSDADVARKVKWEFPNDSTDTTIARNIGYSFGRPVVVKTAAAGWVVLLTSGYNNGAGGSGGDGKGYLYVLNADTGRVIKAIATPAGTAAAPSGLAHISAYVEFGDLDRTTDFVYGGDLLGNLWRFDLSGSSITSWGVTRLANFVDASGKAQPVTTAPELGKAADKRLVLVGTGQYLGLSDIPGGSTVNAHASQRQTFYTLVDDRSATALISPLRSQLQEQTLTINAAGTTAGVTDIAVDLATKKGWYADLPRNGERVVNSPVLVSGAVAFTSILPDTDPCNPGGSSWLYVLGAKDGRSTEVAAGRFLGNALASGITLFRTSDSSSIRGAIGKSDQTVGSEEIVKAPGARTAKRYMWREILRQ